MFTTKKLVQQNSIGYCGPGMERLDALLTERRGDHNTRVEFREALEKLGVSDAVFGFCAYKGISLQDRDRILHRYMSYLFERLCNFVPDAVIQYPSEFKAIRKRCEGHNRPHLLEPARRKLHDQRQYTVGKNEREALFGVALLATPWPDYLAAVHAGVCLMQLGEGGGMKQKLIELTEGK